MDDQKPPRSAADERTTVLTLLQYQRARWRKKVSGVSDEAARTPGVASGTSLLWLLKHLARAESLWVLQRFAGRDPGVGDDPVGPDDTVASAG